MDTFTITLLTGCGTALLGAISALWLRDGQWRKDYNDMVKEMQAKIDATNKDATAAINAAAQQMNSSSSLLVGIQTALAKMDDRWSNLEKEILRGLAK